MTDSPKDAEIARIAEVLCTERMAQMGDYPCSRFGPPHCDECLGMATAVRAHLIREGETHAQ